VAGVEFIEQPEMTCDWKGTRMAARRFRVRGPYSRDQIVSNPDTVKLDNGDFLPRRDSEWAGMKLDRYSATQNGAIFDVFAIYSSDEQANSSSGGFKSETRRVAALTLPSVQANVNGGPPVPVRAASLTYTDLPVRVGRKRKIVLFNLLELPEGFRTEEGLAWQIHQQYDRVHAFPLGNADGTTPYLFEGADWEKIGSGPDPRDRGVSVWYRIAYSWYFDGGVLHPDAQPEAAADPERASKIIVPGPFPSVVEAANSQHGGAAGSRYALPPYEQLVPVELVAPPSANNLASWFKANAFTTRCDHDLRFLDSYASLPGYA